MDGELKEPLERLAAALHRAIEQSGEVERAIEGLRERGFQAHLLLEVTVALGRATDDPRQMGFADVAGGDAPGWQVEIDDEPDPDGVSDDDREFLRAIRIRID